MGWPAPSDYEFSVQNPRVSFGDPDLRECAVVTTPLGLPKVASGNFASVYELRRGQDDRYAVRCFLREVTDQHRRYTLITNHLAGFSLPYIVGFNYVEKGILVGGQWYPIVRMDWVEGRPLHAAVEEVLDYPGTLLELAKQWRGLVAALRGLHMAHGDFQHGNILVTPEGDLRLVDYDGMFVPRMRGEKAPELGHSSYQHPRRAPETFDEGLDSFSALAIFLGIRALASDKGLWDLHDGDNLILKRSDFEEPARSPAFARLRASRDAAVKTLAEAMAQFPAVMPAKLPSLEHVLTRIPSEHLFPSDLLRRRKGRKGSEPVRLPPRLDCEPRVRGGPVLLGGPATVPLKVRNAGDGELRVQVRCRDPRVQAAPPVLDLTREAEVQLVLDTRAFGLGEKTTVVDLRSNGGNATVAVEFDIVQRVGATPRAAAASFLEQLRRALRPLRTRRNRVVASLVIAAILFGVVIHLVSGPGPDRPHPPNHPDNGAVLPRPPVPPRPAPLDLAGDWETADREWSLRLEVKGGAITGGEVAMPAKGEKHAIGGGTIEGPDKASFLVSLGSGKEKAQATVERQAGGALRLSIPRLAGAWPREIRRPLLDLAGKWVSEDREWVAELVVQGSKITAGKVRCYFGGDEFQVEAGTVEGKESATVTLARYLVHPEFDTRRPATGPEGRRTVTATFSREPDGALRLSGSAPALPWAQRFQRLKPDSHNKVIAVRKGTRRVIVGLGHKDVQQGMILIVRLGSDPVVFKGKEIGHKVTDLGVRRVWEDFCEASPVAESEPFPLPEDVVLDKSEGGRGTYWP